MMKKRSMLFLLCLILSTTVLLPVQAQSDDELTDITLFVSYIPSVQFAPMYLAAERGYFADAGINISFEHSFNEPDGVDRIALNHLQFGLISGEQVILGRNAEKPLVYVMEWYHRFPVGVVVPADSDIETPEDLAGRVIGLPDFSGASYIGLLALLSYADLDEFDAALTPIGFNAPELMCSHEVEAATVYITNEPLTIQKECFDVRVIQVSDYVSLVSNGLITNEETIANNPELVASMVLALQKGLADTIADPQVAFDNAIENYVTELPEDQYETQYQVLLNSIELWRSDTPGQTSPEAWELTQQTLLDAELLPEPLEDLSQIYTNEFLPILEAEETTESD